MSRIYLSKSASLAVTSVSGSSVNELSDEEFDKNFDKMMSMDPAEFDAKQAEPMEETLSESPLVPDEPNTETANESTDDELAEPNIEQPDQEVDENEEQEPAAEGEPDSEEEETSGEQDSKENTQEFDFSKLPRDQILPYDIPVNGMKVKATLAELEEGFKKGMNYTQKMQEIAPHRKNMNLMAEHGLSTDDLNLLIEAKKGNKEALGKLLATAEVDPLDIDAEASQDYTPENYAKEVPNIEMEQVKNEILADTEMAPAVENALQTMPEDMYQMVSSDARGMHSLYDDMKSGIYEKVMPEVLKQQALYGMREPTIQTYLNVANKFFAKEAPAPEPTQAPQQVQPKQGTNNKELNQKRKSAGTTPQSAKSKPKSYIQEDLDKMSDEEFDKAFEKMVGRSINDFK